MIQLGVNIDHVATLRQVRGNVNYPDPVEAALIAQSAGADNITLHLREDRRHIQDKDVYAIKEAISIPMNLEVALTPEMIDIALDVSPEMCCLVPEKRQELTTEGGLDVVKYQKDIQKACERFADAGIRVSLFIDMHEEQILAATACGAPEVEFHTGEYALAQGEQQVNYLNELKAAAMFATQKGLIVHAGHGLNYDNVMPVTRISEIEALMIGHAIVARAVFVGLENAVKEMKALLKAH